MVATVSRIKPRRTRNDRATFRPYAPRPYGTPKAVVSEAISQVGGVDDAMVILQLGQSQTYAISNGEAQLRHDQIRALVRGGAVALVEDLAILSGHILLPVPVGPVELARLQHLSAVAMGDFGALMAGLITAMADKMITSDERCDGLQHIDTVLSDLAQLRAHLVQVETGV